MGRYINQEQVIVRLRGKVKTTDNPDQEPDRMPLLLLNRLINEAEGQVEYDLSTRYFAPFVTIDGAQFGALPERPTKELLRTMCELLSVVRVLETDFGRGSSSDAGKYSDSCQKRYDKMVDDLTGIRANSFNIFKRPPLPGLKSNYQVSAADNGFAGSVIRTDDRSSNAGFAADQINDPSQDFWNGSLGHPHEMDWTDE